MSSNKNSDGVIIDMDEAFYYRLKAAYKEANEQGHEEFTLAPDYLFYTKYAYYLLEYLRVKYEKAD